MTTQQEWEQRIDQATSKSDFIEILKDLRAECDENDPQVKELIKRLTR